MKKINLLLCIALLAFGFGVSAQQVEPVGPFTVSTAATVTQMPSIASRSELIPSVDKPVPMQDGRATKNKILIGKGSSGPDALAQSQHRSAGTVPGRTPSLVIETALSNSQPTDPSGAVGPDHYFAVFNTGFRIFDKDGTPLTAQLGTDNIFPASGCCDLTVSYDNLADRWVVSFLGGGVQVAISNGPDPVTSDWTVYSFPNISDYNKLSVWRDGYYVTENTSGSTKLWVLERAFLGDGSPDPAAQMAGFELPGIVTSGFHSPQALNITDDNHPTTGGCPIVYLQDDAWGGVATDHVKLWEATMDWDNTANSTVSAPLEIAVTDFTSVFDGGSFVNLSQPGGGSDIDALQATIMNQAQFRKFGSHNSGVFNFVVDTDDTAGELAGIRWIEIRQAADGGAWTLFQEGTYTAPDGKHAWHASMAMDQNGNIGMGYSGMAGPTTPTDGSADLTLSSYYTGRFAADAPGTMTVEETLIAKGSGDIPGTRYGDYGKMDVDPSNDKGFWFLNEYVGTGGRANVLGVFQLAPNLPNDTGVTSIDAPLDGNLSNAEQITVTIFNFGENEASDIDVTYQIDGGAVVTETFAGPLASSTSAQYTFTATADFSTEGQVYSVTAATDYSIDEDNANDSTTRDVTNIPAADVGVVAVTAPTTGENLMTETVTITIENFGSVAQTGFDVTYTLDGAGAVTENVGGLSIDPGMTGMYTFTAGVDLSEIATYVIEATTALAGDADTTNDSASTSVTNLSCLSYDNTDSAAIGPNSGTVTETIIVVTDDFILTDVNVTVDITHTWDSDLTIELVAPDGTVVELANAVGLSGDNFTNTVFDGDAATSIVDGDAPFTGVFAPSGDLSTLNGLTSSGDWTLRVTDNANGDGGTLNSWILQLCAAESLSVPEPFLVGTELQVINRGDNQFNISLNTTEFNERLDLNVYNMLGQRLLNHRLFNDGSGYAYDLNMSYAAKGIYIVKVGTGDAGKVKRIVVQ
ncbi:proprotein convertase P-domain-containing protein [uncultured Dokdonia sp.]|uniref:proprotein convertase P-domain-containing protein n=1 Tax=Dokdonia sp. Asnod2-E02 TaxID=3160574 RepID=UPI002638A3D9|nr:proprotein convertase P-domain-containing protein [uncultured Dokdonia sp.]